MDAHLSFVGASLLFLAALDARAEHAPDYRAEAAAECPQDAVDAHVREQFASYGPLSEGREYFGFIFLFEGEIGSAVVRGRNCHNAAACSIDTAKAAPLIPKGAKVLGEWHTHPHVSKAGTLSEDDVRGARNNRHIRCYGAYYGQPDGDIYAWNPFQTSVPTAMSSIVLIGNYRREVEPDSVAIIAAQENLGTPCLSTNTNVHTAATTKKCCRRSTTSHLPSARAAAKKGSRSSCQPPYSG